MNPNLPNAARHTSSMCVLAAQTSSTLWAHGTQPTRLLCPWDSPGKNAGVGWHSLLQRIFPDQGLKPGLLHCKHILYHISRGKSLMLWLKAAVICSPSYICSSPVHQLILVVFSLATLLDAEGQPALALHSKFVLGLFHMNTFYGPRKGEVCPWPKQSHKCPTTQIELKFFYYVC